MAQTAPVTWAQRKDSIFVTINVSDAKDTKITLNENGLSFEGASGGKLFTAQLDFFAEVDPADPVSGL